MRGLYRGRCAGVFQHPARKFEGMESGLIWGKDQGRAGQGVLVAWAYRVAGQP